MGLSELRLKGMVASHKIRYPHRDPEKYYPNHRDPQRGTLNFGKPSYWGFPNLFCLLVLTREEGNIAPYRIPMQYIPLFPTQAQQVKGIGALRIYSGKAGSFAPRC